MIGAVIFVIFFLLFLLLSLAGIYFPPGHSILEAAVPEIFQADPMYGQLAEGIINGVIYGVIIWVIFSIAKMIYDRMQGQKEVVVKVDTTSKK